MSATRPEPPRALNEQSTSSNRTRGSANRSRIPAKSLFQSGFRPYHGGVSSILPGSREFRTTVFGTVFGHRSEVLQRLHPGDRLILVPDPPGTEPLWVWVHARGGDLVGHLSPDVNSWLAPAMLAGRCYSAEVAEVRGEEVASWKRLTITVRHARIARSA